MLLILMQKKEQLTKLSYLLKDMSGEARALITPLTDEIQLKIVLNKMEEIGETIKKQAEEEVTETSTEEEKKEAKETSLESLMKFNVFLSIATLVSVAGATVADYVLMAWLWI